MLQTPVIGPVVDTVVSYHQRRLAQTERLADRADDPMIRGIHLDLASRYRALVDADMPYARNRLRLSGSS